MSLDLHSIRAAHERIRQYIKRTPVLTSSRLDKATGASLFFKCENFQKIGAFKARGATNAVFALDDATAKRGVATHSAGNHGTALARAAKLRKIPAHIVMPKDSTKTVFALDDATAKRGVATHSSGNHGTALARAAKLRKMPAHIVMPKNSTKVKVR